MAVTAESMLSLKAQIIIFFIFYKLANAADTITGDKNEGQK
jgi:hypothetical protein